jgi:hypothetical protein
MSEAVGSSETLVKMYQITDGHTPEENILQNRMLGRSLNVRASNITLERTV